MRAEIKEIVLAEEPDFDPENPANFGVDFHLYAGPEGEGIREMFYLAVCSPGWFARQYLRDETDMRTGRHFLFAVDYDRPRIEDWIRTYVRNYCTGETWEEIADKIRELAR